MIQEHNWLIEQFDQPTTKKGTHAKSLRSDMGRSREKGAILYNRCHRGFYLLWSIIYIIDQNRYIIDNTLYGIYGTRYNIDIIDLC